MITNPYIKYFITFIIFISFLVSLNVTYRRYQHEHNTEKTKLSMSLSEIQKTATYSSTTMTTYLKKIKEKTQVSHIIIEESTLKDYIDNGKLTVLTGSEIKNMNRVGHVNRTSITKFYNRGEIKPKHIYIIIDKKKDFNYLRDFLSAEFGNDKVKVMGNYNIIEILDDKEDILKIGLGINKDYINLVQKIGFKPIFKLKNSNRLTPFLIKMKLSSFYNPNKLNSIIFDGPSVLGYPSELDIMAQQLKTKQILIGSLEFHSQKGFNYLSEKVPNNVYRVHSINKTQFEKLPINRITSRYLRAAKERNINMLFLHSFVSSKSKISPIDYNIQYISELGNKLSTYGLLKNIQKQFPQKKYIAATPIERYIILTGIFSLLLYFILIFFNLKIFQWVLFYMFLFTSILFSNWFSFHTIYDKLFSLIASILFPTIAIITQFPHKTNSGTFYNRLISNSISILKTIGICLIGSTLIVALLSDITFLKGIDKFYGVKLSFILPLLFVGLFFYLRPQRVKSTYFVLKRLYHAPVRTAGFISIFSLIFIFIIMIIRSGNLIVLPSLPFEENLRVLLEQTFYVRPRTKEFLIGYPFLFISFLYVDYKISRLWIWFFNIIGSISLISIVNTFCHLHTPLYISFYRTILGILLGILISALILAFAKTVKRLFFKNQIIYDQEFS